MSTSAHLDEIINRHNQITSAQVVFADIEKYSKRRTQSQIAVINAFTACLEGALAEVARQHVEYTQNNNINFQTDIVKLATGDGAAFGFTFDGLHDIHLNFARWLLKGAYDQRSVEVCARFNEDGWCNCHPYFNLRIGISEGKGIIYKDINTNYNLAGSVINLAARVMGLVDRNQIALADSAYSQLIDMVDDPNMADRFREFPNARVKHDLHITVHQYVNPDDMFLNNEIPEELSATIEAQKILDRVQAQKVFELPGMEFDDLKKPQARLEALRMVETLGFILSQANKFSGAVTGTDPIRMLFDMQKEAEIGKLVEGFSKDPSKPDQIEGDQP